MLIERQHYITRLTEAVRRSPVTALLGPRQCGKTTLARMFARDKQAVFYDLESSVDVQRLQNPELVLGSAEGLVVLDEIQRQPALFQALRVLVDKPGHRARYLLLGSASLELMRQAAETVAGRIEFVELSGFDLLEINPLDWHTLWLRGGFPRSFLAENDPDSLAWREGFIRTYLERDLPQLGITIPSATIRRFWTMLAHFHGQVWNASELGRSLGFSDKTMRAYLDMLTSTFMVRQLQPWYVNIAKRQVKSPKIYIRDSGLLHSLLTINDEHTLLGHPRLGASWEGFVIEQVLYLYHPDEAYFWGTYTTAELDLYLRQGGKQFGIECKFSEAPRINASMRHAVELLQLEHLWVIYPGEHIYMMSDRISAWPLQRLSELPIAHL